jgi:hypothetical protein
MDMDTAPVFAAAAAAAGWTRTTAGARVEVSHAGYMWTVECPGGGRAEIVGRYGPGGCEVLGVVASWAVTIDVVDAAVCALRP